MNKILITGSNGFIGNYVCKELNKRKIDYLAIDKGKKPIFIKKYFEIDINDFSCLKKIIINYKPKTIIHLAAIANPVYEDSAELYKVNTIGSENLMKAASLLKNKCRIILISTAGVYGNQKVKKIKENCTLNPINHYSCSKASMEKISNNYKNNLDIHILRLFNVIGDNQNNNFIVPKLVSKFKNKEKIIELGNIDAIRDYVSVSFCANIIVDSAINNNVPEIMNVCSGRGYSVRDIINILIKVTGFNPKIIISKNFIRNNEIWRLVGDPCLLNSFINKKYNTLTMKEIIIKMLNS